MTDHDMREAPYRAIWKLAGPQMLMMVFHFFIGFADVWVAGRLDSNVQASLGIITQSLFFLLVIAMAVANGGVAAISQSEGAGLHLRAKRYAGQMLLVGIAFGALFLCFGLPFQDTLVKALQVPDDLKPITEYFLRVYLYLTPPYYILIITNAIFRARKQVMYPTWCMLIVTLTNTFLDFGLGLGMFGMPELGFRGLAWATFGSVSAGMVFNVSVLAAKGVLVRKSFAPWCWQKKAAPYLFKVAWPSGLMQLVWQSGYLALWSVVAALPEGSIRALAGMAVGLRVESMLFLPAMAFNMTASILVGHYLGAGEQETAKKFGYRIWKLGVVSICLLTVILWQVLDPILAFIAPDPTVVAEAHEYLKYNMLAIPFTLTSMIIAGALNGAGATLLNMFVMGTATWFLRLPLAWWLGHVYWGDSTGVWVAMLASQMLQSAMILYVYQFKDWAKYAMKKRSRPRTAVNGTQLRANTYR